MVTINEKHTQHSKKSAAITPGARSSSFMFEDPGLQYRPGLSNIMLRQLTVNGIMDHFTALTLIKAKLAKVPLASSWQLI